MYFDKSSTSLPRSAPRSSIWSHTLLPVALSARITGLPFQPRNTQPYPCAWCLPLSSAWTALSWIFTWLLLLSFRCLRYHLFREHPPQRPLPTTLPCPVMLLLNTDSHLPSIMSGMRTFSNIHKRE